jgi:predicted nucleotidyltransferase
MPLFTSEQREETVDLITRLLREDGRIEGAVLVGSLLGDADRWSDVDLVVVVAGGADAAVVAADWISRLYEELQVVHHFETAFGETLVRGFLLENLLEVDLAFTAAAGFEVWGPARLVFDRSGRVDAAIREPVRHRPDPPDWAAEAGFAWHDVLHASIAVRRGRLWQGLWYLERVRNRALALAAERHGLPSFFFEAVDDLPAEERSPLENALVPSLDAESLRPAIEAATRGLLAELRRGDPRLADRLEGPLLEFVRLPD